MTDDQTLLVLERTFAYGKSLYKPANANAELVLELTRQKSFTEDQIRTLKALGYRVEFRAPQPTE